jgi:hypothetical protein
MQITLGTTHTNNCNSKYIVHGFTKNNFKFNIKKVKKISDLAIRGSTRYFYPLKMVIGTF